MTEELSKRKTLKMTGGRAYVAYLSTQVPTTANVSQYGKIVAEKSVLRQLIAASGDILDESYQEKITPEEVLDSAERRIFEIARGRQKNDYVHIKDVLWKNIEKLDELSKMEGNNY